MQTAATKPEVTRPRLLLLARDMLPGGAASLGLNHTARLAGRYDLDVLVTGPSDGRMLARLPVQTRVFTLDAPDRTDESLADFHRRHAGKPPFQTEYHAVLATAIFPDTGCVRAGGVKGVGAFHACAAFAAIHARRRLVFIVDEALSGYPAFHPRHRHLVAHCIRSADLMLPVSRGLWEHMATACPLLRDRPWQRHFPPLDASIEARSLLPQSAMGPGDLPGDLPIVVTVARLVPGKQVSSCVRVHHQLKAAGVRFRWYVIGSGPEEQSLRSDIDRLGLRDDFHLLGEQDNPYPFMKAADVFALFSASEGCPTVVREALALGIPVLTTAVNGADELVEPERTGLVVRNDPGAMTAGLARLLLDSSLRQRMRQTLQERLATNAAPSDEPALESLLDVPLESAPENAPRVSVLIPTYNQETFVGKAIASALAQDHPSMEVVVLDDASTDGTERVAAEFSDDPRFRYVRDPQNLGRVANYHRGVTEVARGDWVLMLDGDDFLTDSSFISRATAAVARHADRPIVFVQAGHRVRHLDASRPDADILPPIDSEEKVVAGPEYLRLVFESGFFTHLGALYDRRAAKRLGFYTADIQSSDMESFFRLALEGEVLLLNTLAGCWVQHDGNASRALELGELLPNVRVFGDAARRAIARGQGNPRELARPLLQRETDTLLHLFGCTVGRSACGPSALFTLLRIAFRINPRLLISGRFLRGVLGLVPPVIGSAARRLTGQLLSLRRREADPQGRGTCTQPSTGFLRRFVARLTSTALSLKSAPSPARTACSASMPCDPSGRELG